MKNSFFIKTFGCKVNQFESEYFANKLVSSGYTLSSEENSDIVIINSCAVTKEAERQLMQYLRKLKRNFPNKTVVVTGCSVDNSLKKISDSNTSDIIVSNRFKKQLPEILINQNKSSEPVIYFKNISEEKRFIELNSYETFLHTRKFFKIQDGCDNFCSYCIIPFLRGTPRSLEKEKAVKEILSFAKKFGEVVITGINTGIYGKDLGYDNGLLQLLELTEKNLLKNNVKDFRIRLSSLKPDEITPDFIRFIKESKFAAPHIHLSVQNFSNKILKKMGRKYDFSLISEKVAMIKEILPFSGVGADIITGFPGEEKEDFIENAKKMEDTDINFFHIFPFSKRERTSAFSFKETADKKEKKSRVNALKKIANIKKEQFIKNNLNKKFKVLVEGVEDGYLYGYSGNYIKIYAPYKKNLQLKNNFIDVKGETIKNKFYLLGRIL
jgi:threonylcarbamoyladenosine tRNA methylthiotransferase MtaB